MICWKLILPISFWIAFSQVLSQILCLLSLLPLAQCLRVGFFFQGLNSLSVNYPSVFPFGSQQISRSIFLFMGPKWMKLTKVFTKFWYKIIKLGDIKAPLAKHSWWETIHLGSYLLMDACGFLRDLFCNHHFTGPNLEFVTYSHFLPLSWSVLPILMQYIYVQ